MPRATPSRDRTEVDTLRQRLHNLGHRLSNAPLLNLLCSVYVHDTAHNAHYGKEIASPERGMFVLWDGICVCHAVHAQLGAPGPTWRPSWGRWADHHRHTLDSDRGQAWSRLGVLGASSGSRFYTQLCKSSPANPKKNQDATEPAAEVASRVLPGHRGTEDFGRGGGARVGTVTGMDGCRRGAIPTSGPVL